MQAADFGDLDDRPLRRGLDGTGLGRVLLQGQVRPRPVVVTEITGDDPSEVGGVQDDDVVEALATNGTDQTLDVGALPGGVGRREHLGEAKSSHALPEGRAIDGVAIPQQVARRRVPGKGLKQDWSPDRTRLVGQLGFSASGRGDGIVVYTFGSRTYELVSEFGEWPVWLPDRRRVLFVTGGKEYWIVDTKTKQKRKIYSVTRGVLGPARLTRDGRLAFFPLRLLDADTYLLHLES
jgi:hypothetical protein